MEVDRTMLTKPLDNLFYIYNHLFVKKTGQVRSETENTYRWMTNKIVMNLTTI